MEEWDLQDDDFDKRFWATTLIFLLAGAAATAAHIWGWFQPSVEVVIFGGGMLIMLGGTIAMWGKGTRPHLLVGSLWMGLVSLVGALAVAAVTFAIRIIRFSMGFS